ncbi:MAG: undecaprenyl-diphosphatase [Pseudomonadota bacterium]
MLEHFNTQLFLLLNAPPGLHGMSLWVATAIAEWLIWLVPLGLTVLWLFGKLDDQRAAVKALAAGLIALGVNQLIAMLWFHPRPFMAGIGHTYLLHAADSSFPSDHVTLLLSVGLALWTTDSILARRLAVVLLAISPFVAWARIYLGVHFPLDMFGALSVALSVLMLVNTLKGQNVCHKLAAMIESTFDIVFGQKRS